MCDGILNVQPTSVGPIHKKSPNLPDITPLLTCSQVSMQHLWLSVKALRHMGQLLLHVNAQVVCRISEPSTVAPEHGPLEKEIRSVKNSRS